MRIGHEETGACLAEERFGRWEILRKLGSGMAEVYLVRDPQLDCLVVLKTIEKSDAPATILAIEAEKRGAEIQRQLSSNERILRVLESGERDGFFFVAMEYFPGRTLADLVRVAGRLNATLAARYVAEVCSQLRILHECVASDGSKTPVVHGDIKPSNIQIGDDDRLRLLDFGIAKQISSGRELTRHQLGSPSYCSPERLRDAQVDVQADLWAIGVSLYEMIRGAAPFQAESTRQLERLIQSGKRPGPLPDDCPAAVKAILMRALDADLNCRYPSAAALESDLRAFLAGKSPGAAPSSVRNKAKATTLRQTAPRPHQLEGQPACRPKRRLARIRIRRRVSSAGDSRSVVTSLLAGALAGLLLFFPASQFLHFREIDRSLSESRDYTLLPASELALDWQRYQALQHRNSFWNRVVPAKKAKENFEANLLDSAGSLIGRFRRGADDYLADYDWARARLCLLYALEIDSLNRKARAQLYLCDGYLGLLEKPPASSVVLVRTFRRAASLLPRSPDPHLALARVFTYRTHTVGAALAEFHQAEQLGYELGPREFEQQADGYLVRAEAEWSRVRQIASGQDSARTNGLRLVRGDLDRARKLYEPIAGFDRVDSSLARLDSVQAEQARVETALLTPPPTKGHAVFLKLRFRQRAGSSRWR